MTLNLSLPLSLSLQLSLTPVTVQTNKVEIKPTIPLLDLKVSLSLNVTLVVQTVLDIYIHYFFVGPK